MNPQRDQIQACKFVLEILRWILATDVPIVRVVEAGSVDHVAPREISVPTPVKIEILSLPIGHRDYTQFPVTTTVLTRFLESPEFREQLVRWYAKQLAVCIPAEGPTKKLRRSLAHLTVGRPGKLPPKSFLRAEYKQLVFEIRELQSKAKLPIDDKQSKELVRWGRETAYRWVQFVDAGAVGLEQLTFGSPQDGAKLILSYKYSCSEESIHSGLFRECS